MRFTTLFIDLDGTLYSNNTGLWAKIRERISSYMVERMGFAPEEEAYWRAYYYRTYGTTLRGLQLNHHVDPEDFLAYVHDIPLNQYLSPDVALYQMLTSLPQRKYIFTNADSNHALRVAAALGVKTCIDGIIDIRTLAYTCKPLPEAYQKALMLAGRPKAKECVLIDDSPVNLEPAYQLGFFTILVNDDNIENELGQPRYVHLRINSLHDLPQAMPALWE